MIQIALMSHAQTKANERREDSTVRFSIVAQNVSKQRSLVLTQTTVDHRRAMRWVSSSFVLPILHEHLLRGPCDFICIFDIGVTGLALDTMCLMFSLGSRCLNLHRFSHKNSFQSQVTPSLLSTASRLLVSTLVSKPPVRMMPLSLFNSPQVARRYATESLLIT